MDEYEIDGQLIGEVFALTATEERRPLPRHRHNLTRTQVETVQRARIIVATAEVVTEVGYAAASSKAIIERAGVSSKTFYALFGDKESAFLAAFTLLDGVVVGYARNPPDVEDPIGRAEDGVRAFLEQLASTPLFTRLRIVEGPAAGHRALERQRTLNREFARLLVRLVAEEAERDGALNVPDEEVMLLFVGGIAELVLAHVLEHGTSTLPDLTPTITDGFARLVYGPSGASLRR